MQTNTQAIENYLSKILEKRKLINDTIEKHPLTGIDIHKIDRKEKLFLGGIRKLAYEVDSELISIYTFTKEVFDNLNFSQEIENQIIEIKNKQINLFNISASEIKLADNVDEILKDIK